MIISREFERIYRESWQESVFILNIYIYPYDNSVSIPYSTSVFQQVLMSPLFCFCAVEPPDGLKSAGPARIDIDYHALPPVSELPVEGSVIAYKMVELDASMCPVVGPSTSAF